jgi:hypothetical protein
MADVFTTRLANPAGGDGWLAAPSPEGAYSSWRCSPQFPSAAVGPCRGGAHGSSCLWGGAAAAGGRLALDDLEQRRQLEELEQDRDLTLAQEALRVRVRQVPGRDHELGIPRQAESAPFRVPLGAIS